jgi:hypothetical protein
MNTRDGKIWLRKRHEKCAVSQSEREGKEVAVLACINASGNYTPPIVIFKGKRRHTEYRGQLPSRTCVYTSDSRYIN